MKTKKYKYEDYEAVWQGSQAQGNDLLLLLALVKFRQPAGMYATKETLANLMNCSVDTVERSLKRLKDSGELAWVKGNNFSKRANRYFILLPNLDKDTPAYSTAICGNEPPQSAVLYPRNLPPLNSNETEMKYIENLKFDFTPNSDCFRLSIQVRDDLTVQQILDAKDRFTLHPSFRLAADSQIMSRWLQWLQNEPKSILPVGASRTKGDVA